MKLKAVSGIMLSLLLIGMLTLAFNIQPAKATGTIYIRSDGSVDPPTAPIQRNGDIYTLTGNITSDTDAIVIERNNMVLNGAGYTVQGTGGGFGILLSGARNVTIRNTQVKRFSYGIFLQVPSYSSSNSTITENNITNNGGGVSLTSFFNTLSANNITENQGPAVTLFYSRYTKIDGNNISANWVGLQLERSVNCTISENNITNNDYGICVYKSSNNLICHNNFIFNANQSFIEEAVNNTHDEGYPSGGNYWSDHNPPDLYSGSYQNEIGSDGIGDIPYIMEENNTDRYPLIYPYGYVPTPDVNDDEIVDIFDVVTVAEAFGSIPGDSNWNPITDLIQDEVIDIFDVVLLAKNFGKTT